MGSTIGSWQADARRAFDFIATLYEQAQTAWEDADAFFRGDHWDTAFGSGSGAGGLAMSLSNLRERPFAYLKAMGAYRPGELDGAPKGTAALFGFHFHDTKRRGPQCFAGTFTWSDAKVNCDHWILLAALDGDAPPNYVGAFDVGPGPIHTATPTARGRKLRPGVEQVRWFEIPLANLGSAERLRDVVSAAQAMVDGDDGRALAVIGEVEKAADGG